MNQRNQKPMSLVMLCFLLLFMPVTPVLGEENGNEETDPPSPSLDQADERDDVRSGGSGESGGDSSEDSGSESSDRETDGGSERPGWDEITGNEDSGNSSGSSLDELPGGENAFGFGDPSFVDGVNPLGAGNSPLFGGLTPFGTGDTPLFGGADALGAGDSLLFGGSAPLGAGNSPLFGGTDPRAGEDPSLLGGANPLGGENSPLFGGLPPLGAGDPQLFGSLNPLGTGDPTLLGGETFGQGEDRLASGGNGFGADLFYMPNDPHGPMIPSHEALSALNNLYHEGTIGDSEVTASDITDGALDTSAGYLGLIKSAEDLGNTVNHSNGSTSLSSGRLASHMATAMTAPITPFFGDQAQASMDLIDLSAAGFDNAYSWYNLRFTSETRVGGQTPQSPGVGYSDSSTRGMSQTTTDRMWSSLQNTWNSAGNFVKTISGLGGVFAIVDGISMANNFSNGDIGDGIADGLSSAGNAVGAAAAFTGPAGWAVGGGVAFVLLLSSFAVRYRNEIGEYIKDHGRSMENQINQASGFVSDQIDNAANGIGNGIQNTGSAVSNGIDRASSAISGNTESHLLSAGIDAAGSAVSNVTENVTENVGDTVKDVGSTVSNTVESVGESVGETVSSVNDTIGGWLTD